MPMPACGFLAPAPMPRRGGKRGTSGAGDAVGGTVSGEACHSVAGGRPSGLFLLQPAAAKLPKPQATNRAHRMGRTVAGSYPACRRRDGREDLRAGVGLVEPGLIARRDGTVASTAAILDRVSQRLGVAFMLWSATAVAGPGGRVIRVERTGGNSNVAPRLCEIRGNAGMCVGEQPKAGQTVVVLDEHRAVAELQIVDATSAAASCANLWAVKTRAIRGGASDGEATGVIDPAINPSRARVLDKHHTPASPSGLSEDEVWRAIDRDGDGVGDILITRYSCDSSGKPATGGVTSCVDIWARIGAKMIRTVQINFAQCNP